MYFSPQTTWLPSSCWQTTCISISTITNSNTIDLGSCYCSCLEFKHCLLVNNFSFLPQVYLYILKTCLSLWNFIIHSLGKTAFYGMLQLESSCCTKLNCCTKTEDQEGSPHEDSLHRELTLQSECKSKT